MPKVKCSKTQTYIETFGRDYYTQTGESIILHACNEEPFSPYDPEDHDFMAINIKAMYFSGLWNYHKSGWRYVTYLMYSLFVNFVMILISCTYIVEMYTTWGDLPNFAASVWYFNNFVVTVIKHATLLVKMDKVQTTTQKMRGGILSKGLRWSKEHDDVCRKTNKMIRSFSMIYYYVGSAAVVGIIILGLKSSYYKLYMEFTGVTNYTGSDIKMILPCSGWYPFDTQDPTNYLLAFAFQIIPLIVGPITNIGSDTFVSGLIFCACGEFRVLEYSLRTLKRRALQLLQENKEAKVWEKPVVRFFENGDETEGLFLHRKEEMDSKLYEALIECIHHHQEILNFVRELEELFSSMMLIQFVSISVRICLNICSILFTKGGGVAQFTYSNMLVVSFLQGLPYCWFGSELTYQSENVSRVLYETPWLEGTFRFRRAILFMVARAQKTLILTGGKIYVMSLETFQSMVYASFSFFRLLQEFGEP